MTQKPKTASSILSKITRDPAYVNRLQGMEEPAGRDWDGRFTNSKIPQYDAFNDKYCKFNMRRRAPSNHSKAPPPAHPMNAWAGAPLGGISNDRLPQLQQVPNQQPKPTAEIESGLGGGPAQSVEQLFSKAKLRIIKLWDELGVPEAQRLQFAQHAMALPTIDNVQIINDEIQRLLDRRNAAVQVEKAIEVREGFLYLLQELAERYSNGTVDKDRGLRELLSLVTPFRNASLDVVESIVRWKETLRTMTTQTYLWKGVSYLYKMLSDLFFLVHSRLGLLLDFEVRNNALLDPRKQVESVAPGKLAPIRRAKDVKDLPKERLDKADRVLMEEQQRQQHMQMLRTHGGEADVMVIEEEVHLANLARDEEEQQQLIIEEDQWLQQQQREAKLHDAQSKSAVKIQKVYRGFVARKFVGARIRQRLAVIKMQTIARQFIAKLRVEALRKKVNAAKKLQALHRGGSTRNRILEIRRHHDAATTIQRIFRGHLGRRYADMHAFLRNCARKIQAVWRGHRSRRFVRSVVLGQRVRAATKIQAVWRGVVVRMNPMYSPKRVRCAIRIQAWIRGILDRQFARQLILEHRAAVRLQSWWRMLRAKNFAAKLRLRSMESDWKLHLQRAHMSATKIQSVWRMEMAKRRVASLRDNKLSDLAKRALQMTLIEEERQQDEHIKRTACAVTIQRIFRGFLGRRRFTLFRSLNQFATEIQRVVRGYLGRQRALRQRDVLASTMPAMFKISQVETSTPVSLVAEGIKLASDAVEVEAVGASMIHAQPHDDTLPESFIAPDAVDVSQTGETSFPKQSIELTTVSALMVHDDSSSCITVKPAALEEVGSGPISVEAEVKAPDAECEVNLPTDVSVEDACVVPQNATPAVYSSEEHLMIAPVEQVAVASANEQPASANSEHALPSESVSASESTLVNDEVAINVTEQKVAECDTIVKEIVVTSQVQVIPLEDGVAPTITPRLQERQFAAMTLRQVIGSFAARATRQRLAQVKQRTDAFHAIANERHFAASRIQMAMRQKFARLRLSELRRTRRETSNALESDIARRFAGRIIMRAMRALSIRRDWKYSLARRAQVAKTLAVDQERSLASKIVQRAFRAFRARNIRRSLESTKRAGVFLADTSVTQERDAAAVMIQKMIRKRSARHITRESSQVRPAGVYFGALLQEQQHAATMIQCLVRQFAARLRVESLRTQRRVHSVLEIKSNSTEKSSPSRVRFNNDVEVVNQESGTSDSEHLYSNAEGEHIEVPPSPLHRSTHHAVNENDEAHRHIAALERELQETKERLVLLEQMAHVNASKVKASDDSKSEPGIVETVNVLAEAKKKLDLIPAEIIEKTVSEPEVKAAVAPEVKASAEKPEVKAAAEKPEVKAASAEKPEVKAAAEKPEVKASVEKPEVKAAAEKPEVKAAVAPEVKAAAEKPEVKASVEKPEVKAAVAPEVKAAAEKPEVKVAIEKPEVKGELSTVAPNESTQSVLTTSLESEGAVPEASESTTKSATSMAVKMPRSSAANVINAQLRYMLSASIVAYWREKFIRNSLRALRQKSSTKIQCAWRCHIARQKVAAARQNRIYSIQEQNEVAARVSRERIAQEQLELARLQIAQQAAVVNEDMRRKEQVKQEIEVEIKRRHSAALTIQCALRSYNARFMADWKRRERHQKRIAQERVDFARISVEAAIKIQRHIRRFVATRKVQRLREDKQAARDAIAKLEALRHSAAVKIQCMYRVHNARFEVAWRREERKKHDERMKVQKLSAEERVLEALREKEMLQRLAVRQQQAAVTIQCAWRCYNARFELMWRVEARAKARADEQMLKKGTILCRVVQRIGRGYLARKRQFQERAFAHTLAAQELLLAEYEADSVINTILTV